MYFSRLFALFLAACLTGAAFPHVAAAQTKPTLPPAAKQVLATIHQFMDGFNSGNLKSAFATCAPRVSIIDEVPPHEWQGSTACPDWARDLAASDKAAGVTAGVVTLGTPWRVDVNGTTAYAVIPTTYAYRVHGKAASETGSVFTVALRRFGGTWRITGWAWSAH